MFLTAWASSWIGASLWWPPKFFNCCPYKGKPTENFHIHKVAFFSLILIMLRGFTKIHRAPVSRFVVVITTHSDPSDGGLFYGNHKTTTIDQASYFCHKDIYHLMLRQLISFILGKIDFGNFSNSILIINTCGGFMDHWLEGFRATRSTLMWLIFDFVLISWKFNLHVCFSVLRKQRRPA